jgi:hypothetical protein
MTKIITINFPVERLPQSRTERTFWLLWKAGHLTDQDFNEDAGRVAAAIDAARKPLTVEGLESCILSVGLDRFSWVDARAFSERYLEFFTMEKDIEVVENYQMTPKTQYARTLARAQTADVHDAARAWLSLIEVLDRNEWADGPAEHLPGLRAAAVERLRLLVDQLALGDHETPGLFPK